MCIRDRAKGCKKSLEIRCKSLEIGSVQLCGTQGLPSVFEPYVIHPGPCQPDQHAYWCQVWKRQTSLPGVSLVFLLSAGFRIEKGWDLGMRIRAEPLRQSTETPNSLANVPNLAAKLFVCSCAGPALSTVDLIAFWCRPSTGFFCVASFHCGKTEALIDGCG